MTFKAFIVESEDSTKAKVTLDQYLKVARRLPSTEESDIVLEDPYHASFGQLHLRLRGRYLWGAFCDDPNAYGPLLTAIEDHVRAVQ